MSGTIGFFDTRVHGARPFSGVDDIRRIVPVGGGGTDYSCIFRYIHAVCGSNQPTSIVIITDGEGVYPPVTAANNIPVLWLLTEGGEAPWGRCVRL